MGYPRWLCSVVRARVTAAGGAELLGSPYGPGCRAA